MSKSDYYKSVLIALPQWEEYLMANSCLPGPRSNLELLYAFMDLAEWEQIYALLQYDRLYKLPQNNPQGFLVICAVAALGKICVNGDAEALRLLRSYTSDFRWRIREAVAMAIQHVVKMDIVLAETIANDWVDGNLLECRAIAAGLCEPPNLKTEKMQVLTLNALSRITHRLKNVNNKEAGFKELRQALAYCWSVAVVANPGIGRPLFEALMEVDNKDIRWIVRENLKKNRIIKMDSAWVQQLKGRVE